jgi:hypothetical protein
MKLLKSYKESKLQTRIIVFLVTVGFVSFLSWFYKYDVLATAGIITGVAVIAELTVFHAKYLWAGILTILQFLFVSSFGYIIYTTLTISNSSFMAISVVVVGLVAMIASIFGSFYFAKGKLLTNIITSYIIYDIMLLGLLSILNPLQFLLWSLIALGSVVVWLILRRFVLYKRVPKFDLDSITKRNIDPHIKGQILRENESIKQIELAGLHNKILAFQNKKVIFLVLPLRPEKYFTIIKNDAWLDQEVITGAFEVLLNEAKEQSNRLKLNQKNFIPIIYTSDNNELGKRLATLKIRSRVKPEQVLGNLYIATKKGLDRLLKEYEDADTRIPEKVLETL